MTGDVFLCVTEQASWIVLPARATECVENMDTLADEMLSINRELSYNQNFMT